jgi:hypothetical protein
MIHRSYRHVRLALWVSLYALHDYGTLSTTSTSEILAKRGKTSEGCNIKGVPAKISRFFSEKL